MTAKTFEILDRATFIPVLAVRLASPWEEDRYLLGRAGFQGLSPFVMLYRLTDNRANWDHTVWGTPERPERTMTVAHKYIYEHFDELKRGSVIDVQAILGETKEPKESERVTGEALGHDRSN